ncbi:MAG: lysoplasmalogenase [Bacteroidetes bacterium]|nr:lysoplasmalogenase [Bacteroidota bacterium]
MKPAQLTFYFLFLFILIADIMLMLTHADQYRYFTKPLLVPMLLLSLILGTPKSKHAKSKMLIILALIFCFMGDLLLLFEQYDIIYFQLGLAAFLIGHVFYIIFFTRIKPFAKETALFTFLCGIGILAYIIFILVMLWRTLAKEQLELPVALYAFTIGLLLLSTLNLLTNRRMRNISWSYFIPGAAFFVLSDSILAWNKFYSIVSHANVLIIITYAIAQFLLVAGASRFLKKA